VEDETSESRYLLAKYDGERYETVSQTFDYPYPELKGGYEVARIDYTLEGTLVTMDHWEVYWRDEWPLRLAFQFLSNCLYPASLGYAIRVNKDAYAFWASEWFTPLTNDPTDFMLYTP
jgi:hypothetical protein